MKTKKPQNVSEQNKWIHEFENLYILTYKSLYRHAKLIFNQEEKTKELLVQVYMEAYQRGEQLQKEKCPLDWLLRRSDFLAETKLEATREMIEASYAEEKMQSRKRRKKIWQIWMRHRCFWKLRIVLELWKVMGNMRRSRRFPRERELDLWY